MRAIVSASFLVLILNLVACGTVSALRSSTVSQGRTVTELLYQMVLDNLAMIRQEKDALPWHLDIQQGGIGVTDSATPSFSLTWPPASRTAGITATRQLAVSWTVKPVLDVVALKAMRDRYQAETRDNFSTYYEEGTTPPDNTQYGRSGNSFIWVRGGQTHHFTELVFAILNEVPKPKEGETKQLLLPGPQAPTPLVR